MTRWLVLTYLTIAVVGLTVLVVPLGLTFSSRERDRLLFDIERDATVVATLAEDALEAGAAPALDPFLDGYATDTARIIVVNNDGRSVYDNTTDETRDFASRPEIIQALDGQRSNGTRPSDTLGHDLVYVAVPVASGGTVHGAVRITYPTSTLDARIREAWFNLATLSVVVLVTVTTVGWLLARSVTEPVRALRDAATDLADGDLTRRAPTDRGAPELRDLADTFNTTAETLEALLTAQQAFVADASHQLRTPLTALRLRLENLGPSLADAERTELDAAIVETDRLARLVDGLLTLARSDHRTKAPEATDVVAAINERLTLWGHQANEHHVTLVADTAEAGPVLAVPGTLDQILDNLISNALNAAPSGSTITIETAHVPPDLAIHVRDQGKGLSSERRMRAFDRFWRAPDARGRGSGLGLAIVAELVAASGGRATLDEAPGGGLDAMVCLPLVEMAGDASRPVGDA